MLSIGLNIIQVIKYRGHFVFYYVVSKFSILCFGCFWYVVKKWLRYGLSVRVDVRFGIYVLILLVREQIIILDQTKIHTNTHILVM